MRALIFHPMHNAHGKKDVTGAFKPEAHAFARYLRETHDASTAIHVFDNSAAKGERRASVESAISVDKWDVVALFCHGLHTGLQTGHDIRTPGSVEALADVLATHAAHGGLILPLYACDTAEARRPAPGGDGGFADALRDALATRGVQGHIDAHTTTAHTTKNPHVRRFEMDGGPGVGGDWLVAPRSPKWSAWRRALKGDMRFRFPLMTREEIEASL